MGSVLALFLDLIRLLAKISQRGGARALIAEHLILRQQLLSVRRKRHRTPPLSTFDRVVLAISSLFISGKRLIAPVFAVAIHKFAFIVDVKGLGGHLNSAIFLRAEVRIQ